MQALHDLIEISHFAARHPEWVQGGGGNCSVKSGGKMWVKASGYFMEDVSAEAGYAVVDPLTGKAAAENLGKPSMETPLHTLLGSFVIHTHPISVAALVSSVEGEARFREIFPEKEFLWIGYADPGKKLFEKVKESVSPAMVQKELVLFLQNHGLFVSAPSKAQAVKLHEGVVRRANDFFGSAETLGEIPAEHYLTPDHAVYAQKLAEGASKKQTASREETIFLAQKAVALILKKGWTPRWLRPEDAASVLGMEDEKYRQQIWKKS